MSGRRRFGAVVAAVVAVVAAAALLAFLLTRGDGRDVTAPPVPSATGPTTGEPEPEVAPLTGLVIDHDIDHPAVAVKVSDVRQAHPQLGVDRADIVFVEAPESEEEFRRVGGEIDAWLLANMVPTGNSPVLPAERLKAFGFDIAIYPTAALAAMCAALEQSFRHLAAHGSTQGAPVPAYTMAQLHELVGFPEIWAFEKRFAEVQ